MDLEVNVEDNNVDSTVESVFTIDKVDINVNEIVASTSATTPKTEPTSVTSVNSVQATSGDDYFKAVPRATIGVQVSTTDFQPRFMTFIQNERQLSTITGDAIMVDKGFFIDEICAENRWKLVRPPFLSNKKQKLSKAAAVETAQIAKARVHIERYNAKIKTFKIVEDTMPAGLVKYLDDIFLIICATINISSPILKDKHFMKQNEMTE
ncbi:hypothetical protein HCN44_008869 [Aphidius gifuensis]|uniref:DDE Tnp4 domain-containing protein n=1 Tax=Aphidius gifuensis TaxID=684658 RepID=A0A834Y6Z9_APHGI|nr:hypothetical protein HCN44_008869 [Aphidius gifuensis]